MVNKLNKEYYNTVLAQALSPCGNYLVVGDIYGCLSIFHLSKIVNPEANLTREELVPKCKVTVKPDYQINSLISAGDHLLVGGFGEIYGYAWKQIKTGRNQQPLWTIEIPDSEDEFNKAEVNCIVYDKDAGTIYAGCGDNKIYVFNLEQRRTLKTFSKHTDYIHCICKNGNRLLSSGEDGIVNIWDIKSGKVVDKIEPHANSQVARPDLGIWIGALDCNDDYVVCGGGPRLTLYHYRFLSNSMIFPIDDKGIHVADIYKDKVFAGGRAKFFYQSSFNGDIVSEIPTSGATAYTVVRQEEPFKVMCIAGSSPKIDVCCNFMYKDQQLFLY
ncbi:THO complex subunit 6 [Cylas formicarius]|uniref:THO complex subunit 6 n=1 Tax=Cylas formicarius TaxID=197179 RepID=UPI002958362A|nr:THO complex subunit 6 [Cylas formicarius]